ncbi:MAG: hypothetical protein JWN56_1021 [Sphingobacteriales bacterium]|nr:hypothetical protein [Sphingobacteriales bacterium]
MFFKGEIPFVRLLLPLIVGISIGYSFHSYLLQILSFYTVCLFSTVFLTLIIIYKTRIVYRNRWLMGITIHLLLVALGCYLAIYSSNRYSSNNFQNFHADALVIKVVNEPNFKGDIMRFESNVLTSIKGKVSKPVNGKLLIALKIDSLNPIVLNYGDVLLIPEHFTEVDPPFNPGEFDYKGFLANHQIYHQSFINQQQLILLAHNKGNSIIYYALGVRKDMVKKYYQYLKDKDAAAFASTLILGYRADLSPEIISAYSKTGTMHVLSVSGMHVGIVFIILIWILKPLNKNKRLRLLRAFLIIAVIWFYSLITGFSPSVCRAAIMLTFFVFGKAINRSQNSYNLLAISAFILLIYNPYYLVDVGFQLSYIAVFGLIYFHPKIYHLLNFDNWFLDKAWSYTALSLAAQLATFPLSIYYFHQFPVYFLLSNLFIVLPVAVVMYAGILFLFIPWDVILKPLGTLLNTLIGFTNRILYYIEHLPYSNWDKLWINLPQYILLYVIIGCVVWASIHRNKLALTYAFLTLLIFSGSIAFQRISNFERKELVFFSLRKNSAIAFQNSRETVVLTDLNLSDKTWSFSINPAIDRSGSINKNVCEPLSQIRNEYYNLSLNYIQFGNYRILRWDKSFNKKQYSNLLEVDALLLSGNPTIKLVNLIKNVHFTNLLIDATNPDYKIKRWKDEAKQLHLDVHVLKKNPAFIVKL